MKLHGYCVNRIYIQLFINSCRERTLGPVKVVRIGLPSTLLLAIRTNIGTVRRTTFGLFRKSTKGDPDYLQLAFQRPRLHLSALVRITFWFVPRVIPSQCEQGLNLQRNHNKFNIRPIAIGVSTNQNIQYCPVYCLSKHSKWPTPQ